ncbi:MAG: hypothetical protein AB3N20_05210 [Rhizobiaceae bacterium]
MAKRFVAVLVIFVAAALGACTSTPRALESVVTTTPEPAEPVGDASSTDATTALTAEPATPEATTQVASLASDTRIRLSPVVGAPENAVQLMSRRIASRAAEQGIGLVPPGTSGATHDMKGYFSAITESGKTTVIFVWDVFDTRGKRLHRIQGQESSPGSSPDGWSSVSSRMMERIGTRTVDEFSEWLKKQKRS